MSIYNFNIVYTYSKFYTSTALSGTIFAIFLGSLVNVCGHCISVQLIGTIGTPYGPDSAAIATTTPSSFSAVLNW